ncbi:flagellar hook-associated protein FlgK [Paracoccus pacificus]|uniref:Flagellar hook-associated protein 1 n=1 Tax=Paracoccus pacificus TaxID=1463598 RepID=A0ABW4R4K8_9RHOB
MSIANALSNALSGLTASARGVEVVSSNLANALTPGYGRRELQLSPRILSSNGGGVRVDGIRRAVTMSLVAANRSASADAAAATAAGDFARKLEGLYGLPGDGASLSDQITRFQAALTSAAARPDSDLRLESVAGSAKSITEKLNAISAGIQSARADADGRIGDTVDQLNNALRGVSDLNRQIVVRLSNNDEAAALIDQRQKLIDEISTFVPIKEIPRQNGQIALFTESGGVLLDGGKPATFAFQRTPTITADMTVESGNLSTLTVNGIEVNPASKSFYGGGLIGSLFAIRDQSSAAAQKQVDAYAASIYTRFSSPAVDPTLNAGQAGLFTDNGDAFYPANSVGLASRLKINAAVDAGTGGSAWRIRAGLYAASPGNVSSDTILNKLADALTLSQPVGGGLVAGTAATQANDLSSRASTLRVQSEARETRTAAQASAVRSSLMAEGVDSDYEMSRLLELEKAYAANARVIQAADEMLQNLMRL